MTFKQPPVLYNEKGSLRTVGFELEYSNVGIEESVQVIQELYGGTVEHNSRYKKKVKETYLGDFTVEFDLTLLTEQSYKKFLDPLNIHLENVKLGESTLEIEVESALESIVGKVFPFEIACPPIPCTQLHELEKLREALYQHHAEGTQAFLTNAFGTHINMEAPRLDTETLLRYLRGFLLLYPWLLQIGKTDLARRISPFIDPYPAAYVAKVLAPSYQPDLQTFTQDYHTYNPDRNRPLDMYPILAALNNEQLQQYKGLGKVKARNTFHYRLPNSSIALPNWTLAEEWNNWIEIEVLASDPEKLEKMSQEYIALREDTLIGFDSKWIKRTTQWLT
ncbi:amidoligase family protein [Pontibacter sp. SGAir0037]|uniref:amidoligase family protein n=1 Tax=Pontibacter sp. SGAir0037 TaxID=2571030 RepID=UPI0010CCEE52|nr:amidoligase family protein [Pontibacter sp. SGAir0037]QCR22553.1 amidoligase [Pontibacter sp. SGAir0037]